jgi:hypothetical protein
MAERRAQPAAFDREIGPAGGAVAPDQRQRVVAELAHRRRRVCLEAVGPAPQQLEAQAVPCDRIERREQPHRVVCFVIGRARVLVGRPVPVAAVDAGMREPGLGTFDRGAEVLAVLRDCVAQPPDQGRQRRRRQRRVLAHDDVDERIDPGAPRRRMACLRDVHMRRVDADAVVAPTTRSSRGSACRRAGGWSRSTSRPSSW